MSQKENVERECRVQYLKFEIRRQSDQPKSEGHGISKEDGRNFGEELSDELID